MAALSMGAALGSMPAYAEEPVAEVHVTGDAVRDPIAPKDRSVASSVVPRERLAGPGLEAQDVLRTQPGVAVSESGGFGAPATAAIRGATAAATPVYLAGVRLNDDVAGTADLSMVPLWLIDRIEIYRGNAPLEADRLAPGGAIFFEPRRPQSNQGGFGYYAGSWGTSKAWVHQALHAGSVQALVGVSADHATNRYPFVDDHGTLLNGSEGTSATRENADQRTLEGWGLARVDLGKGAYVDVLANGIRREQGVATLAVLQSRRARGRTERALGAIALHVPLDARDRYALDARTSFLVGSTSYDDPLRELSLQTTKLDIVGRRIEQSVAARLELGDRFTLRPMVNVAHERIERDPDDVPIGRAHREFGRLALGAEARLLPGVTLRALGSGECHHTGATDATCDVLEPTGRVGVQLGDGRVRMLANLGRYVRVPTLGEVYGVNSTVHGNPNLRPEDGYTADLGVRIQTKRGVFLEGAFLDAFVFAHSVDGLIAYQRAGQGYVVPYNVGRARVLGAELLGGVALTKIVRAEVAATFMDPRDTSPERTTVNDILPFRSRLIAVPRLRADWKGANQKGPSAIGGEARAVYQASRYADPAGLGVIDEQVSFDLEAYVAWFDGVLTTRARVADLFDARRTDIIGYPLPGRSAYFGVEASW
ncbi:TonB-dependent receptor [Pendulispora rubella]|uniref:TonB-dependent receptor n=1 Tax=Pendulispora rubella TaxID=2741070 RepID=A0ABZ2L2C2_9BACT